jgi:shikimate kinase
VSIARRGLRGGGRAGSRFGAPGGLERRMTRERNGENALDAARRGGGLPRNIVLVGFMGTGKSTVARLLAARTGFRAVDTDEEIVRRAGKPIADIFAADGEPFFRELESRVLAEVLAGADQVIATGGGAVLREENRRRMLAGGWVVALTAARDALVARLAGEAGVRPLLAGGAAAKIDALLAARRHAYDFAHCAVDTSRRTPEEVAGLLARWAGV